MPRIGWIAVVSVSTVLSSGCLAPPRYDLHFEQMAFGSEDSIDYAWIRANQARAGKIASIGSSAAGWVTSGVALLFGLVYLLAGEEKGVNGSLLVAGMGLSVGITGLGTRSYYARRQYYWLREWEHQRAAFRRNLERER